MDEAWPRWEEMPPKTEPGSGEGDGERERMESNTIALPKSSHVCNPPTSLRHGDKLV